MLSIGLISFIITVPLFSNRITPSLFNRITSLVLIYSALLSINVLYIKALSSGVGIYSGLFHVEVISLGIEIFIFLIASIILTGWAPVKRSNNWNIPSISEYSLMILFATIGMTMLISSSDLVSMYLSIELQSFAVYILTTLYRDSESATSAGLKYFLLGGLSSALILLGTGFIYAYTGLTSFESIQDILQVEAFSITGNTEVQAIVLGLTFILLGLLFKVSAAPLHNWAPDVYDGSPTIVTIWLTTMPKISIFTFLCMLFLGLPEGYANINESANDSVLQIFQSEDVFLIIKNLLLLSSMLSLIVGTVLGLSQYRIKRLLAYSTISHVGFLLLCLGMNTFESVHSFLFYLMQYSITNACTFLTLLAFSYVKSNSSGSFSSKGGDLELFTDLRAQFKENPLLAFSLSMCLFSMAGIPPLIGFFAKQSVLYSSIHQGYYFMSLICVVTSVISASYYLKLIHFMYFVQDNKVKSSLLKENEMEISSNKEVTSIHSLVIAILTMIITLFLLDPQILLNSCQVLALSLFYN